MQCQYVNKHTGRCKREAEAGSEFCSIHAALSSKEKNREGFEKRMYLIQNQRMRERHASIGGHEHSRSLREEVDMARMLLEERLNAIKTDADLSASCGAIKELLLTIERLESSCLKIDQTVGNLLSKTTLTKIASGMVQILIDELIDIPNSEEIIDKISDRIFLLISNPED